MRHLTRKQALALAAIIALVVAALIYALLNSQARAPGPEAPARVAMIVAETDIDPFETITVDMVGTTEVAESAAPTGHLSRIADVVGKLAQRPINSGEAITRQDVAVRTAAGGLTFVIPDGTRAATVAIDPVSGVAGFALPGDRVDVLTTFERDDTAFTKTILQDIAVLAIGQATTRPQAGGARPAVSDAQTAPAEGATPASGTPEDAAPRAQEEIKHATLAVTPDEAQSLILAAARGSIHLVLRPTGDTTTSALPAYADWEMMGLPAATQQAREEPPEPEQPPMMTAGYPAAMWQQQTAPAPQPAAKPAAPQAAAAESEAAADEPVTVEVVRGSEREVVSLR